eukprot:CAMPEP_0174278568 /NCGR_PEP_ID=MMETSP0439-20130205/61552_1 /TAXON_ID=0 /ORGANISM="Stereomyxa ramosa, Strain Chinc5" /LENGTH=412 /DNA_ID=CAMNT_0015370999 /DNA_START=1324 /DNA_END=2558 /DNA_ORIENTATION=+
MPKITTLKQAASLLIRAVLQTQAKIIAFPKGLQGPEINPNDEDVNLYEAGTTCLLGGLVMKISGQEAANLVGGDYIFVCINIGNSKAYLCDPLLKKVVDVTEGNIGIYKEIHDTGGRIGPHLEPDASPDLRNMSIYMNGCSKSSVVVALSAGAYSNFDPQYLGITPASVGIAGDDITWNSDLQEIQTCKDDFRCRFFTENFVHPPVLLNSQDVNNDDGSDSESPTKNKQTRLLGRNRISSKQMDQMLNLNSPEIICNSVLGHCKEITKAARRKIKDNPTRKFFEESADSTDLKGKLGQSTCVAVGVAGLDIAEKTANSSTPYDVVISATDTEILITCCLYNPVFIPCFFAFVTFKHVTLVLNLKMAKWNFIADNFMGVGEKTVSSHYGTQHIESEGPSKIITEYTLPCKVQR